ILLGQQRTPLRGTEQAVALMSSSTLPPCRYRWPGRFKANPSRSASDTQPPPSQDPNDASDQWQASSVKLGIDLHFDQGVRKPQTRHLYGRRDRRLPRPEAHEVRNAITLKGLQVSDIGLDPHHIRRERTHRSQGTSNVLHGGANLPGHIVL